MNPFSLSTLFRFYVLRSQARKKILRQHLNSGIYRRHVSRSDTPSTYPRQQRHTQQLEGSIIRRFLPCPPPTRPSCCSPGGQVRRRAGHLLVRVDRSELMEHAADTTGDCGFPGAWGACEPEVHVDGLSAGRKKRKRTQQHDRSMHPTEYPTQPRSFSEGSRRWLRKEAVRV